MKTITSTPEETMALGREIAERLKPGAVILLTGPLGAGKTVLARGIAEGLEIKEHITSPTFTLLSQYEGKYPLYHFDFYRIEGIEDFETLGAEEFLYDNGVSIVEWGEKLPDPPAWALHIHISILEDGRRGWNIEEGME